LEILECDNFRDIEANILSDPMVSKNLYRDPIKVDESVSFEVVELSDTFTYDQLLAIVKKHVARDHTLFMSPAQTLEKEKLDIEKEKLNIENRKLDMEQQKMNHDLLLLSMFRGGMHMDDIQKAIKNTLPDISKTSFVINGEPNKEKKNHNPNNDIMVDINRNAKPPQGKKIRKIDSNDLTKVVTVYDSMMYLLRSPENVKTKRFNILEAIQHNSVYDGYRWNFVEKNEKPNEANAKPTNLSKRSYKTDVILQLNETKTKILKSFLTKTQLFTNACALRKV
jgi:hypothetical protein